MCQGLFRAWPRCGDVGLAFGLDLDQERAQPLGRADELLDVAAGAGALGGRGLRLDRLVQRLDVRAEKVDELTDILLDLADEPHGCSASRPRRLVLGEWIPPAGPGVLAVAVGRKLALVHAEGFPEAHFPETDFVREIRRLGLEPLEVRDVVWIDAHHAGRVVAGLAGKGGTSSTFLQRVAALEFLGKMLFVPGRNRRLLARAQVPPVQVETEHVISEGALAVPLARGDLLLAEALERIQAVPPVDDRIGPDKDAAVGLVFLSAFPMLLCEVARYVARAFTRLRAVLGVLGVLAVDAVGRFRLRERLPPRVAEYPELSVRSEN